MFSVIFDMDGTLFDTQAIAIPAWEHAGRQQGFTGMGAHVPNVCGMNETNGNKYLAEHFEGLDVQLFRKTEYEYIDQHLVVKYKKGAEELIAFLKENNIPMAIASGSSRECIEHNLNEIGAPDLVSVYVGGKEVQNGKPAPDIFLLTAQKMGVDPKDCFVFEDSNNGIRAGYAAGMKCIGIPDVATFSEEAKAMMYAELSSLDEAIEILKKQFDGHCDNV